MDFSAKMLRDDALKGKVIVITGGGSGLGKNVKLENSVLQKMMVR